MDPSMVDAHAAFPLPDDTVYYDISDLDKVFERAGILTEVQQIKPETPDFDTLRARFGHWYKNATEEQRVLLDEKLKRIVTMKKKFADKVGDRGLPREEFMKSVENNPASQMLGFDLESDILMEAYQSDRVCPVANDYNEQTRRCEVNEIKKKKYYTYIGRRGVIVGGEVERKEVDRGSIDGGQNRNLRALSK